MILPSGLAEGSLLLFLYVHVYTIYYSYLSEIYKSKYSSIVGTIVHVVNFTVINWKTDPK